jgi:gamma-glutamyltranspeptidase/glutathione hydrolase
MHTIIPGMLCEAGKPMMPFGVMGGQYQPTGHARLISNILDFGLSPQEAIDAPRSFFDGGALKLERGYTQKVVQELADLGHAMTQDIEPIGGAQAIRILQNGVLEGASDPRKDGCALGY